MARLWVSKGQFEYRSWEISDLPLRFGVGWLYQINTTNTCFAEIQHFKSDQSKKVGYLITGAVRRRKNIESILLRLVYIYAHQ